jgi:hypothetical protein
MAVAAVAAGRATAPAELIAVEVALTAPSPPAAAGGEGRGAAAAAVEVTVAGSPAAEEPRGDGARSHPAQTRRETARASGLGDRIVISILYH